MSTENLYIILGVFGGYVLGSLFFVGIIEIKDAIEAHKRRVHFDNSVREQENKR